MPTENIDQQVRRMVELIEAEVQELQQIDVTSEDKLSNYEFGDYPKTLPVINFRKLYTLKRYLAKGEVLNAGITMAQI